MMMMMCLGEQSWRELYAAGSLSYFYTDTFFGNTITLSSALIPEDNSSSNSTLGFAGLFHMVLLSDISCI